LTNQTKNGEGDPIISREELLGVIRKKTQDFCQILSGEKILSQMPPPKISSIDTFLDECYNNNQEILGGWPLYNEFSEKYIEELQKEAPKRIKFWITKEFSTLKNCVDDQDIDPRRFYRQYQKGHKSPPFLRTPGMSNELCYLVNAFLYIEASSFSPKCLCDSLTCINLIEELSEKTKTEIFNAYTSFSLWYSQILKNNSQSGPNGFIFASYFLYCMMQIEFPEKSEKRFEMLSLLWFKKLLSFYYKIPFTYPILDDFVQHDFRLKKIANAYPFKSGIFLGEIFRHVTDALKIKQKFLDPVFHYSREQIQSKMSGWPDEKAKNILGQLCEPYNPDEQASIEAVIQNAVIGFNLSERIEDKQYLEAELDSYLQNEKIDLPRFLLLLAEGMECYSSHYKDMQNREKVSAANNAKQVKKSM